MRFAVCAVWGAGVASLWWAFACLEVSKDDRAHLLACALIASIITMIRLMADTYRDLDNS